MLQKLKKNIANTAEPADVAVLLMSWVFFHLDYYARHIKLNILGRIVIPDEVALGSSAVICYHNHTEKV